MPLYHSTEAVDVGALRELGQRHYDEERYDQALAIAHELLALDPQDLVGLDLLALSLTFLKRHDEAIAAYGEALGRYADQPRQLPDPRGLWHFNRGCELAHIGQHTEALDDLERAVALDARFGTEALADDYWRDLWSDARFLRLVGQG